MIFRESLVTIDERLEFTRNRPSGFDYLRIVLAVSVVTWHTIFVCYGFDAEIPFWTGPLRPLVCFIIPSFFALSGFLVAGSLARNSIPKFLTLRAVRIFPALAVEVLISALLVGPAVTSVSFQEYFTDREFYEYFLNILGIIHFKLPGVFNGLPAGDVVNVQLWTVPIELDCYIILSLIAFCRLVRYPKILFLLLIAISALLWLSVVFSGHSEVGRPSGRMIVLAFLFGVVIYLLRKEVTFNYPLFLASLVSAWLLLMSNSTTYLAPLPVAYVTIFLGLQNPKKLLFVAGADYSYGVYLYGFPIQQLLAYLFPDLRIWYANLLGALVLTTGCAFLSWTFIEEKLLRHRNLVAAQVEAYVSRCMMVFQAMRKAT